MASTEKESTEDSAFVCECYGHMRSACSGESFYRELGNKRYCILHCPCEDKGERFNAAVRRKLETNDFNFQGVWFPALADFGNTSFNAVADFSGATFSSSADFFYATFTAAANFGFATFNADAGFSTATFTAAANFSGATFNAGADFSFAKFKAESYFGSADFFAKAFFRGATFDGAADFGNATFRAETDFGDATLGDHFRFSGVGGMGLSSFDLQFATVKRPEWVSFHSLSLRPRWFVNVDARKFEFTNVEWAADSISKEIGELRSKGGVASPSRMLSIAYRQLAVNAEENHRYEEASRFRFLSMDARRREQWHGFVFWRLSWWYWAASGYGERFGQAAAVLILIILGFAFAYNKVGFERPQTKDPSSQTGALDDVGSPLNKGDAIIYSLQVMTFQRPDPRPLTRAARCLVTLELILGPVQAALFVLAVRRKFIR